MMRQHRVRAIALMEIVYLVPIVAAALAVTYQVTVRTVRMERRVMQGAAGEASQADLLRRLGEDAGCAESVTLDRSDKAVVLELSGCRAASGPSDETNGSAVAAADTTIRYRIADGVVTRQEQPAGQGPSESYRWSLQPVRMDLALESIGGSPRLVWISFIKPQKRETGPEFTQKLATAVRIGPGGVQ